MLAYIPEWWNIYNNFQSRMRGFEIRDMFFFRYHPDPSQIVAAGGDAAILPVAR